MKIKDKLTLRFVLTFATIWVIASLAIYYSSAAFRQEEFYQRLESKANTAAKLLIEVEEVDALLLQKIEAATPIRLPGEKIIIYDYNNRELFSTDSQDSIKMNEERFNEIRLEGEVKWKQGQVEVLGILYTDRFDRFVVVAGAKDLYGIRKLDNLRNILLIVFLSSLFIISFAARLYAGKALQPMSEVVEEVNQIGITNLDKRVSEGNGKDEIATLGITFNRMLDRIQSAFMSQKSFITNASHELRTPMTSVLSLVDVTLLRKRTPDSYRQSLASVREEIKKLSDLTTKLLLLARVDAFKESLHQVRADTTLWQAVAEVSQNFTNLIHVDFDAKIDDDLLLTIHGSEQLIKSVFLNILENACKYSRGQDVHVTVSSMRGQLLFKVADSGIGMSPDDLKKIGEPFFRGSNTGELPGSGIGLSIVKKIIEIHHGSFELSSELKKGTTATISLPTHSDLIVF